MRLRLPLLLVAAAACTGADEPNGDGRVLRTERNELGLVTCSPATPDTTCYAHRAVVGVSMGAGGAGQLGLLRPELFDAVGMLGIPLVDWTYLFRNLRRSYLGGFCDMETILANLDRVNEPYGPAFCGPVEGTEPFDPDRGLDGNGPRFFDGLVELMAHVEQTYRVKQPVEVPQ